METCVSFADAGVGAGTCQQYCGPEGGCPSDTVCAVFGVSGGGKGASNTAEKVCVPPADVDDASFAVDGPKGSSSSSSGGGSDAAEIPDAPNESIGHSM
jgi:hypothetical protein